MMRSLLSFKRPRSPHDVDTSHRNRRQHVVHRWDSGGKTWRAAVYRARVIKSRRSCSA